MILRALLVAVVAGVVAGLAVSLLHSYKLTPLIYEAETYESGAASTADENAAETWSPADGLERISFGWLANLLTGVGFALLLVVGFILSGRQDDDLHFQVRHMVGHLCVSTYHSHGVHAKHLPQWIFRGAAHWLCKLHPRSGAFVTYCSYEGVKVTGSGRDWHIKARKIAVDLQNAVLKTLPASDRQRGSHGNPLDFFTASDAPRNKEVPHDHCPPGKWVRLTFLQELPSLADCWA